MRVVGVLEVGSTIVTEPLETSREFAGFQRAAALTQTSERERRTGLTRAGGARILEDLDWVAVLDRGRNWVDQRSSGARGESCSSRGSDVAVHVDSRH